MADPAQSHNVAGTQIHFSERGEAPRVTQVHGSAQGCPTRWARALLNLAEVAM